MHQSRPPHIHQQLVQCGIVNSKLLPACLSKIQHSRYRALQVSNSMTLQAICVGAHSSSTIIKFTLASMSRSANFVCGSCLLVQAAACGIHLPQCLHGIPERSHVRGPQTTADLAGICPHPQPAQCPTAALVSLVRSLQPGCITMQGPHQE